MQTTAFVKGTVLSPERMWAPGTVLVEDGIIRAAGPAQDTPTPPGAEIVDASGLWVAPGLVDLHIHGLLGHDCMDGDWRK